MQRGTLLSAYTVFNKFAQNFFVLYNLNISMYHNLNELCNGEEQSFSLVLCLIKAKSKKQLHYCNNSLLCI